MILNQNPDLYKNFEKIAYWLMEFENEIHIREMAFDSENKMIAKKPNGKNFGFWTDGKMRAKDFLKNFICEKISEKFFWENGKIIYNYATG